MTFNKPTQTEQSEKSDKLTYVLDTNVLLHDPQALFRFDEHDIVIPMIVLEELDRHKKGSEDLARNARQVSRHLADLLVHGNIEEGFPLSLASGGLSTGRLFFFQHKENRAVFLGGLDQQKADNQILACAMVLGAGSTTAVLVTKDVNLRVKALASGVPAQDYRSDRVELADEDLLPTGYVTLEDGLWDDFNGVAGGMPSFTQGRYRARVRDSLPLNTFVLEEMPDGRTRLWQVEASSPAGSELVMIPGNYQGLLTPRSSGQLMAMSHLNNPHIDVVTLLGPAGTGKTLMAVAAGLEQVRAGRFKEILITRATVSMGEDIGFLPGTEGEKMDAWLGGTLRDVFSVLDASGVDKAIKEKIDVASMSFMRGRSFQEKFIIVDEAQNLSQKNIRALLTRAGDGSKVVLTGNLAQIDTPYLDEGSSGLSWAVQALYGWEHAGHLILKKGERSRLASYVESLPAKL